MVDATVLDAFELARANGSVAEALDYPTLELPEPAVFDDPGEIDPESLLSPETRQLRRRAIRTAESVMTSAANDLAAKQAFSNAMLMTRVTDDQGVTRLWRELFTGPNRHDRRASTARGRA
jgi:hypothetical protein